MIASTLALVLDLALAGTSAPVFDGRVARLCSRASEDSIRQHLQRLQAFGTRYASTDSCRAAEDYLHDYFAGAGLDSVAYDSVFAQGVHMRNVLGFIRGSEEHAPRVLIGAHLDATSEDPRVCAPGIEDDGSGVAVVMEAARILAGTRPRHTLEFIAFAGEELQFLGSEHLAAAYVGQVPIAAFLNLDMVAWPGGAFGMKVICDSASRGLAELQSAAARLYTTLDPQIVQRIPLPGDDYPFQIRGVPVISNIERFEHDTDGYKWYHSCADSLRHLDLHLATEIAKSAVATLLAFDDLPIDSPQAIRSRAGSGNGSMRLHRSSEGFEFEYVLSAAGSVVLEALEPSGRVIQKVSTRRQEPGTHRLRWTAPAGRVGVILFRSGGQVWREVLLR